MQQELDELAQSIGDEFKVKPKVGEDHVKFIQNEVTYSQLEFLDSLASNVLANSHEILVKRSGANVCIIVTVNS